MWRETGLGRGNEQLQQAIRRQVAQIDNEQDPKKLASLVKRIEIGRKSEITGSPEVEAAIERAKRRLNGPA